MISLFYSIGLYILAQWIFFWIIKYQSVGFRWIHPKLKCKSLFKYYEYFLFTLINESINNIFLIFNKLIYEYYKNKEQYMLQLITIKDFFATNLVYHRLNPYSLKLFYLLTNIKESLKSLIQEDPKWRNQVVCLQIHH